MEAYNKGETKGQKRPRKIMYTISFDDYYILHQRYYMYVNRKQHSAQKASWIQAVLLETSAKLRKQVPDGIVTQGIAEDTVYCWNAGTGKNREKHEDDQRNVPQVSKTLYAYFILDQKQKIVS